MVLDKETINEIKEVSSLLFEQAKDFATLAQLIYDQTRRSIGTTTLKRLFGYIYDEHKPNSYTLNTLAIYLGYATWDHYCARKASIEMSNRVYINDLKLGSTIEIKYLSREVVLEVIEYEGKKALKIVSNVVGGLRENEMVFVYSL